MQNTPGNRWFPEHVFFGHCYSMQVVYNIGQDGHEDVVMAESMA